MGKIHEIVFDCDQPAELAAFWSELLEGYTIRPDNQSEAAVLAALGLEPDPEATVILDGPGPSICFQNVDGRRPDNNRVHFDVEVGDRQAEVERLHEAGAQTVRVLPTYTIMRDPEGNQFVLVDASEAMAA
jgi:uncharacterized membrane protein